MYYKLISKSYKINLKFKNLAIIDYLASNFKFIKNTYTYER